MSEVESENVCEFVDLLNHEDDYEILNVWPFTIRRKRDHYVVSESINSNHGYVQVNLNCRSYLKHRLICEQFLANPDNLPCIDHINRDKTDYHLSNLRYVSHSTNCRNKSSNRGVELHYVDDISDESMVVDFYETKNGKHSFKNYYYHDGVFYYDNDINYRILNINETKSGYQWVSMKDINGKTTNVYINRFLKQHDLL